MILLYLLGILYWNCCGPHHEPNRVPRKARALRYGVAQLSASEPQERCAAALGKGEDFLQRAFTVIFLATIVIWFLQSFDIRLNVLPTVR